MTQQDVHDLTCQIWEDMQEYNKLDSDIHWYDWVEKKRGEDHIYLMVHVYFAALTLQRFGYSLFKDKVSTRNIFVTSITVLKEVEEAIPHIKDLGIERWQE